jgi:hypothetical protein
VTAQVGDEYMPFGELSKALIGAERAPAFTNFNLLWLTAVPPERTRMLDERLADA